LFAWVFGKLTFFFVILGTLEYILMITDAQTMKVRWNITFGEYASAALPKNLFMADDILPPVGDILIPANAGPPLEISSSVDGTLVIDSATDGSCGNLFDSVIDACT
jgi:hypothetical protein